MSTTAPLPPRDPSVLKAPEAKKGPAFEPQLHGESRYDRLTSMLMSIVVGAALVVGMLMLVYVTNEAYAGRVPAALEVIEVIGGGGGSPDGVVGGMQSIDVPGAAAGAQASNAEETDASEFEPPAVQETSSAVLDALAEPSEDMAEDVDLAESMPSGSAVATGVRASRVGNGQVGFGPGGPGDGGVPPEQRWSIIYNPGQTAEEYARQLDGLNVELATVSSNDSLVYASNFSAPNPTRRVGIAKADGRLYFLWQGRGRKEQDVAMLKKAGIDVGEKPIFQFYPKGTDNTLRRLEVAYKGRQPAEIRTTRFSVVPAGGGGYTFAVLSQETLR